MSNVAAGICTHRFLRCVPDKRRAPDRCADAHVANAIEHTPRAATRLLVKWLPAKLSSEEHFTCGAGDNGRDQLSLVRHSPRRLESAPSRLARLGVFLLSAGWHSNEGNSYLRGAGGRRAHLFTIAPGRSTTSFRAWSGPIAFKTPGADLPHLLNSITAVRTPTAISALC